MAYVRRTWQERVGTLLNRFMKSSETSTSVVLVNDPDTITQAGTPFTAAAMNNIEDGIVEALAKVPTGVDNNVLLSDGAGKAKDSGIGTTGTAVNKALALVSKNDLTTPAAVILAGTGTYRVAAATTANGWPVAGDLRVFYEGDSGAMTSGTGKLTVVVAGTLTSYSAVIKSGTIYYESYSASAFSSYTWTSLTAADGTVARAGNAKTLTGQTQLIGGGTSLSNIYNGLVAKYGTSGTWEHTIIGSMNYNPSTNLWVSKARKTDGTPGGNITLYGMQQTSGGVIISNPLVINGSTATLGTWDIQI